MFLLDDLFELVIFGPAKGLAFLGRQVEKEMEVRMGDEQGLHARLFELQLELDRGDISEDEYLELEDSILQRLEVVASRQS